MIIRTAGSPCFGKPATPAIITGPSSNDLLRNPTGGPARFHAHRSCYVLARPTRCKRVGVHHEQNDSTQCVRYPGCEGTLIALPALHARHFTTGGSDPHRFSVFMQRDR